MDKKSHELAQKSLVTKELNRHYAVPLLRMVEGIKIQPSQTKPVNLLSLVEELKKSVVMIKVY